MVPPRTGETPVKLVIHTQYRENYGAHDWNGEGVCPQYWKNKGGDTFVVAHSFTSISTDAIPAMVDRISQTINKADDFSENTVIGWELIGDHDLTEDERLQLEYDGCVSTPSPRIDLDGHFHIIAGVQ